MEKTRKVFMDVVINNEDQKVTFNMIFIDGGEIRQKTRSLEWLMERAFRYELQSWEKNRGELIEYEDGSGNVIKKINHMAEITIKDKVNQMAEITVKNEKIKKLEKVIENGVDDCGYTRELHDLTYIQARRIQEYRDEINRLNGQLKEAMDAITEADDELSMGHWARVEDALHAVLKTSEACKTTNVQNCHTCDDETCGDNKKSETKYVWIFQMCPSCGNKVEYWEDAAGYKLICGKCLHEFWKGSQKKSISEHKKKPEQIDWGWIKRARDHKSSSTSILPMLCEALLYFKERIEYEAGLIDAMRFGSDMK